MRDMGMFTVNELDINRHALIGSFTIFMNIDIDLRLLLNDTNFLRKFGDDIAVWH